MIDKCDSCNDEIDEQYVICDTCVEEATKILRSEIKLINSKLQDIKNVLTKKQYRAIESINRKDK